jgi:GMP synthase-like glutamine amidotransferase
MNICILDNDILDGPLAASYPSFAALFVHLFGQVNAQWTFTAFQTPLGHYPASFDPFDAIVLTGSRADAFSDAPWVVELRKRVTQLLQTRKKMLGVCFGHQLIALCMGAPVTRAPQGLAEGRMTYTWHRPDLPYCAQRTEIALLASHQDQVLELPAGASLVASSAFCPIAAFTVDQHVLCIQAHPEFTTDISTYLLDECRAALGEDGYHQRMDSLALGHEGEQFARVAVAFLEQDATPCA